MDLDVTLVRLTPIPPGRRTRKTSCFGLVVTESVTWRPHDVTQIVRVVTCSRYWLPVPRSVRLHNGSFFETFDLGWSRWQCSDSAEAPLLAAKLSRENCPSNSCILHPDFPDSGLLSVILLDVHVCVDFFFLCKTINR